MPSFHRPVLSALEALVGLIYPPSCIACGAATGTPHALCPACWRGMRFIEPPYCERLGTPFAVDLGVPGLLSPAAMADPPVFARARAAVRYDDAARRLVHRLKYEDRLDLAAALGGMMARAGSGLLKEADVVVPVPLWRWRLWWRRFNQAALLARHAARESGVPVEPGLLARVKRTRPQVGLTRAGRAENLQGAFRVPPAAKPRLQGRRVLLVDDVMTTGATANAAARALLRGGAAAVDVLTFACVVHDGLPLVGEAGPESLRLP
ncbi:ComF family protein [Methylobacterium nodulans]|uniref:Phosphoribosyltransferase n=1 Tax=Methylobacterium nodulans (strain LMG 21967 / CNCM I-2342 / ORS 2060) TaxID=460265 RepID=B8IQZ6_METNO|nr:ComF family protein [Methylobacterium nodulans]ACL56698.1 phosphoribosyltransferase [Methylobacterium nodulans ORS 2060]